MPRRIDQQRARLLGVGLVLGAWLILASLWPADGQAAAALVQTNNTKSTSSSSVSLSYSPAAVAGYLLVVVCSQNGAATISVPTGFTSAINESTDPAQGIFYKVAVGGETSVTCNFSASGTSAIQIFEYSGIHGYTTLDAVNASTSTGTTTPASSGTVTTNHASDLLLAAVTSDSSSSLGSWTNSFTGEGSSAQGGNPSNRISYGAADLAVGGSGSYSTTVSVGSGSNWRGQIAAFRVMASSPALNVDIVDGSGNPIASPTASLSATTTNFVCQSATGTLGSSTQKIRLNNSTDNPAWTVSIAASAGPTASWAAGSKKYDFNDPTSSGCSDGADTDSLAGQLSLNPSVGTITPASGCNATNVTRGGSSAFSEGSINNITLLTGTSGSQVDCYWDLTGVTVTQKVPPGQAGGNYSLGLTITVVAN